DASARLWSADGAGRLDSANTRSSKATSGPADRVEMALQQTATAPESYIAIPPDYSAALFGGTYSEDELGGKNSIEILG
ncbi:hypothetical protein, partial [Rhodovulum sulfidophilum]|uniref:hypothetical protein n=1 Tax=Rhodovulum sulfidophilum TaxID=35806 RepID=UPI001F2C4C23